MSDLYGELMVLSHVACWVIAGFWAWVLLEWLFGLWNNRK